MTKTVVAMLDDKNNKANKNSFVNGHPTWRRWRELQTIYWAEKIFENQLIYRY